MHRILLVMALLAGTNCINPASAASISINPTALPAIATVDERYQSYNVEMAEVVGGKFWKPYGAASEGHNNSAPNTKTFQIGQDSATFEARPPVDLTNSRLRTLAAALGPSYVRVSGTWANTVFFQNTDEIKGETPPKGFQSVLTRYEWKRVIDFAHVANAEVVTSFAIGDGVRNSAGLWTSRQAKAMLDYTKSIGGKITAAEFFNEPSFAAIGGAPKGYNAKDYARDFAIFRSFAKAEAPNMLLVGPGSVGEGITLMPGSLLRTSDLLAASPHPKFDLFSYHSYAAASQRCTPLGHGVAGITDDAALSEAWLSRPEQIYAYYARLRDRFEPEKSIWITETADAACGGNPWASTFLDTFRYLDQLGRLAKHGVKAIFHNTLASSDYGLLDQTTFMPRPDYWAALLWRRFMGTTVLDAGVSPSGLHLYAQCLRDHPGGVALLAINLDKSNPQSIDLTLAAERFTLTATTLSDGQVMLNGKPLALAADDSLPVLNGTPVEAGSVELAPESITFIAITNAQHSSCK
jgi:heparanase